MNSGNNKSRTSLAVKSFDLVATPAVYAAALLLKLVRRGGVHRLPACKRALLNVGVFPVNEHYYEPLFRTEELRADLARQRSLPGVDLNEPEQLAMVSNFEYREELTALPLESNGRHEFHYHNSRFGPGDAELLFSMLRRFKPRRLIEIGSGFSTLAARAAIARNHQEMAGYTCKHVCIEPYEEPWLEHCGATVIRKRVEDIGRSMFQELEKDDMLFIDSSHMIRPRGDVLVEYLELLPLLRPGVLVHVHDIFTPNDYPPAWICDEVRFWNEQYLLEAFLSCNPSFKIVCALNYLKHSHPDLVAEKFPILGEEMWREPGSFWMQRV